MSTENIQQIVDIAMKPNGQTANKHILVVVIVCMIPTILFGIDNGIAYSAIKKPPIYRWLFTFSVFRN